MDSFLTNVEEYWEEVKDQYDVSFEEFKIICRSPFKFVKEVMSSGILKNIRLKYFGVFEVSKSRVNYCKKSLQKNYDKGLVSKKHYNKRMEILNNYD